MNRARFRLEKIRLYSLSLGLVLVTLASTALAQGGRGPGPVEKAPVESQRSDEAPSSDNEVDMENPGTTRADLDRFFAEGRFAAAAELAARLRTEAAQAGDGKAATRLLIREVQAQVGLGATETALRLLLSAETPREPGDQLLLALFRGETLSRYFDAYSWEIGQREKIVAADAQDVSVWTSDQLNAAILAAFGEAFEGRQVWGTESTSPLTGLLQQNDYPARIRGTLRDTVSYLFAEALGNSARFSPRESSEIYLLDLAALLAPAAAAAPGEIAAPGRHPLERLRLVLADLEAWHLTSDRPEAALEARLALLSALRVHFTAAADRERFEKDLTARLETLPASLEWHAMGLAQLAEWQREGDAPDALKRAYETALRGAESSPGSLGGRRCRALVEQLETPNFQLEAMQSDGPRRASVVVRHTRLRQLHFRAYRLLPGEGASATEARLRNPAEITALIAKRPLSAEWKIALEDPGDFRQHTTHVVPPLDQLGSYLILASEDADFELQNNRVQAIFLQLSAMVVLGRSGLETHKAELEVLEGAAGRPLEGTEVALQLRDQGRRQVASGQTDRQGRVVFDLGPLPPYSRPAAEVRRGQDILLSGEWLYRPEKQRRDQTLDSSLIFTDRPIYRPGQKVLFKVITYRREQAGEVHRVVPEVAVKVSLYDQNNQEVAGLDLLTNRHGSAAGELVIPLGRSLGQWSLRSSQGAYHAIAVEEYKRPTFEVEILDPEKALRLNQEARLFGSARYYFGLPLRAGQVNWRVTREPFYPRWWCWWQPIVQVETVAAGSSRLDEDGRFEVLFTPKADERLASTPEGKNIGYRYRVSAELTDEGGETRDTERSFRLGFVAIDASLEPTSGYFTVGEKMAVQVRRFDLDGRGRAGAGSWRLVRLEVPAQPLLPADLPLPLAPGAEKFAIAGDRRMPRFAATYDEAAARRLLQDGPEVARGELLSGEDGNARLELAEVAAGLYRLYYRTADVFGAEVERSRELVVHATGRSYKTGLALLLEPRGPAPRVGEELRLLAGSGLAEAGAVLEIFRGEEKILRYELGPGQEDELRHAVVAADRQGLVVELRAVVDHQVLVLRREIDIPRDDLKLDLTWSTFRDRLRPGTQEKFALAVKSADGSSLDPVMVEILAYMYDRSLDVFVPDAGGPGGKVSGLWPYRRRLPPLMSSIRQAWPFWRADRQVVYTEVPSLRSDRLTFYDEVQMGGPGFGGRGGMMVRSLMIPSPAPQAMMMAAESAPDDAMDKTGAIATAGAIPPPPPPPRAEGDGAEGAAPLRQNFAETAFFEPHLQPGEDGGVAFEFTVPDAVTEWNVWALALADDFRYGESQRTTRTVKDLLVRPYLPRFLREGDRAELRISVDNAGAADTLRGQVNFSLVDEKSGESLLAEFGLSREQTENLPFVAEPGKSAILRIPLVVPPRPGAVVLRVSGRTEGEGTRLEDGEQRLLPILPSRQHLIQSRFAVLSGVAERRLVFAELKQNDDATRLNEQMVVTLDGQLFTSVLRALPYLVDYPYRCTEQNLNRFVSTGILTSLFDAYPAIAKLAAELAQRETPLEPMDAQDPNRAILLEETPWLQVSRGGEVDQRAELAKVLDPRVAKAVRDGALEELRQAQDGSGGFPWWPGGQPSPFLTLYLLQGLAQASEFGVEVPRDVVERGWAYLRQELNEELERLKEDRGMREAYHQITWLNYILSIYPDLSWTAGAFSEEDRERMLATSLRFALQMPPRLRLYLAMTAQRAGRQKDAARLLETVMDSAKTTPEEGTFWLPEERAWLFYWDRIETHALALRAVSEIAPRDERRHGLVLWLMLNKKLNQWSSTRSTAEVLYSLVAYLKAEGQLGVREEVELSFAGKKEQVVFAPEDTNTRRQRRLPGEEIVPARDAEIGIRKSTPGLLFASATWHFSTERLPAEARGDFFRVERRYFRRAFEGGEYQLRPLVAGESLAVGDEVEVELTIAAKHEAEFVHLRDPRGAGFEPVDLTSGWRWDLGISHYREIRDSATNFFFERLPPGEMKLKYRLRAATAGTFRVGSATLQSMYAPDFAAYSAGNMLEIEP